MKRGNLCAIILPKILWKWNGLKTFIIYYFFLEWKTQQWHSQNNNAQNTLDNDYMKQCNRCGMIVLKGQWKRKIVTFRIVFNLIVVTNIQNLECPKLSNIIGSAHYQCKIQRVEFSLSTCQCVNLVNEARYTYTIEDCKILEVQACFIMSQLCIDERNIYRSFNIIEYFVAI